MKENNIITNEDDIKQKELKKLLNNITKDDFEKMFSFKGIPVNKIASTKAEITGVEIEQDIKKELKLFFKTKDNKEVSVPNFANKELFKKFLSCFENFKDLQSFFETVNKDFKLKEQIIRTSKKLECTKYELHKGIIASILGLIGVSSIVGTAVARSNIKAKLETTEEKTKEALKNINNCENMFYNNSTEYVTGKDGLYIPKIDRLKDINYEGAKMIAQFEFDPKHTRVKVKERCNEKTGHCCYLDYRTNGIFSKEAFEKAKYNYILDKGSCGKSNFVENMNKKYPELVNRPFCYCAYNQDYDAVGTEVYDKDFPKLIETQFGNGTYEKSLPIIYGIYDNDANNGTGTQTHIYPDGTTSTEYYGHPELSLTNSNVNDTSHPEFAKAWEVIKVLYDIQDLAVKTCSLVDRNGTELLQSELERLQKTYKGYNTGVTVTSTIFSLYAVCALCYVCATENKKVKIPCPSCKNNKDVENINFNGVKEVFNKIAKDNNIDQEIINKFNENIKKIEAIEKMNPIKQKAALEELKKEFGEDLANISSIMIEIQEEKNKNNEINNEIEKKHKEEDDKITNVGVYNFRKGINSIDEQNEGKTSERGFYKKGETEKNNEIAKNQTVKKAPCNIF